MKKLISAVLLCSLCVGAHAQNTASTFGKNDNVLGLGVGVGGVYGFSDHSYQTPVIGLNFDHAITELDMGGVIGVGGFIGYKGYGYDIDFSNNKYYDKWSITIIGARGTFHYDLLQVENLDTYGGAMIAFHILNNRNNLPNGFAYNRSYSSALYASLFAGAKYYFSDQVATYMELGYGVSWATFGLAYKF